MKRFLPLFSVIIFPYLVILVLFCLFNDSLRAVIFENIIFQNNALLLLLTLIIIYIIALISSIIEFIKNIITKRDTQEILYVNMVIKLLHIPAYIIIFLMGLLFTITIFTFGITVVLIIFDCMTIFLSGLAGLGGLIKGLIEKKLSIKRVFAHGILQFIFCADIISSIIVYKKLQKSSV